ncbi:MAG: hypothetical protein J5661_08230 [Bacteroidaceae bacterium]|nr:hypothetical protein [Bacteroidaceae bacterium]
MSKNATYKIHNISLTAENLIVHFYGRSSLPHFFGLHEQEEQAAFIINALLDFSIDEIIELVRQDFKIFHIQKKDVPQFSDLMAVFKIPFILKNCGINGVGYDQMGYMLRTEKRNIVADRKYGENHMKTAEQMGLCELHHFMGYPNAIGNVFASLGADVQKILIPHFCLSIPFIQNYFMTGENDDYLEMMMNVLSDSTKTRRRPNVNTLISIIKESSYGV